MQVNVYIIHNVWICFPINTVWRLGRSRLREVNAGACLLGHVIPTSPPVSGSMTCNSPAHRQPLSQEKEKQTVWSSKQVQTMPSMTYLKIYLSLWFDVSVCFSGKGHWYLCSAANHQITVLNSVFLSYHTNWFGNFHGQTAVQGLDDLWTFNWLGSKRIVLSNLTKIVWV